MKIFKIFRGTIFASRAARRSFFILFFGFILLISASLSIFGMYLLYGRNPLTPATLADNTIKAVLVARSIPINQLPKVVRVLSQRGTFVHMSTRPGPQYQILQLTDPKTLREYIYKHSYSYRISIQLANGQWLNIHGFRFRSFWISLGALISGIVLLLALLMVCIWAVKRLAWPWDTFTKAARRFGVDMDAPPLAVSGPREMQVVIKAFNEMQARIRRLMHDRTQMLAAISHDLRTPITRLQLRAESIEDKDLYEKTVGDLTDMEKMISSILSFARDSISKEPMEWFDLEALLDVLCNDMQDVGQPVNFDSMTNGRVSYFGRSNALKRAFSNLIENAIKYGKQANVSFKYANKELLQLLIEDEGPGIPEHQMEEVFSPFYRLDAARSSKKGGAGLGMATARDIIRAHGGDVTLYNKHPHGLRVVVTLPVRA